MQLNIKPGAKAKANLLVDSARQIASFLEKGTKITTPKLNSVLTQCFGSSQKDGQWTAKDSYEVLELATVIYLKNQPQDRLSIDYLKVLLDNLPTHTKRSKKQVELQQFSTPITISLLATVACQLKRNDILLEPSAGNGLLAAFGSRMVKSFYLNEIDPVRAGCLELVFDTNAYRVNAEQLDDRLDYSIAPTAIVMNPPFTARLNTAKKTSQVVYNHLASALERLEPAGRIVAITQESAKPSSSIWKKRFFQLQQQATVVFSCGISGSLYRKHGTNIDTRITVIDKIPATNANNFDCFIYDKVDSLELLQDRIQKLIPSKPPH